MKIIKQYPATRLEVKKGKNRSKEERYVELNGKHVGYDINSHLFYNIASKSYFKPINDDNGMQQAIDYITK